MSLLGREQAAQGPGRGQGDRRRPASFAIPFGPHFAAACSSIEKKRHYATKVRNHP
jgi:hypothetical protein